MGSTVFAKVEAQNLNDGIFDTNDLSTIRGSSLILLDFSGALIGHLETIFPDLDFEVTIRSASVLVFAARGKATQTNTITLPKKTAPPPKGTNKRTWRNQLEAVGRELTELTNNAVIAAAKTVEPEATEERVTLIAGMIVQVCQLGGRASERAPLPVGAKQEIEDACVAFLNKDHGELPLSQFTFATATLLSNDDLTKSIIDQLDTELGLRQLQQPSVFVPPASKSTVLCDFTRLYGADAQVSYGPNETRPISSLVKRRREYGRKKKHTIYSAVLGQGADLLDAVKAMKGAELLDDLDGKKGRIETAHSLVSGESGLSFANDFEEIVSDPPEDLSLAARHSLAVVHIDGNKFGSKIGARSGDPLRFASMWMDVLKADLMARIVSWVRDHLAAGDHATFETLLWGGDEFVFVLPGWKALEFADFVRELCNEWFLPAFGKQPKQDMNVAIGVAIAPHKSPVRNLKNAASDLVDAVKSGYGGRAAPESRIQAIAFESVDRIHFSPEQYRKDWLRVKEISDDLAAQFDISDVGAFSKTVADVVSKASKTTLHKWRMQYAASLGEMQPSSSILRKMQNDIKRVYGHDTLPWQPDPNKYPLLPLAQFVMLMDYLPRDQA